MNIVVIGAHPDDAEFFAGGAMTLFARSGHRVVAVSLSNGDIGHHEMGGEGLAQRRKKESQEAAKIGGYDSFTLNNHDGELMPTLELRQSVTRIIREYNADMVFTHRPNDYHPDHRYTSQVVQDAAFMVTVPQFCPDVESLRKNPVFLYFFDPFQFPAPFRADVAVSMEKVMEVKWKLLHVMTSQFYEWLPWLDGNLGQVPPADDEAARFAWLKRYYRSLQQLPARQCEKALQQWYGESAYTMNYAEMFQICEYGTKPERDTLLNLFSF